MKNENEKFDKDFEPINSEIQDIETTPSGYEIVTYPADYTLEGIVSKYDKGLIKIPGFQRKYVWKQKQASRLIESFLLGLPVPSIFLYAEEDGTLSVIDGQQRIMSVVYFFKGTFSKDKTVFFLEGLNEKSPYHEKTYENLKKQDETAYNKLNDAVLRAFVIKQLNPNDATSVYHIFERLNTGGTQLASQEIRNCIYHGEFNNLLNELNLDIHWRKIFGKKKLNERQRDVELILRFYALYFNGEKYEHPMVDFLSGFMKKEVENEKKLRTKVDEYNLKLNEYKKIFTETAKLTVEKLGEKPFKLKKGLNAAIFDSVFTVIAKNKNRIPKNIQKRYKRLLKNKMFVKLVSDTTTSTETVKDRLKIAQKVLF